MSFLNDVLSTVQNASLVHVSSVKQQMEENIQVIKSDIKKYMEDVYQHKTPRKFKNNMSLNNIEKLEGEINLLIATIADEVEKEIGEWRSELLSAQIDLKETVISLQISKALITIDKSFNEINANLKKNKFLEAATSIKKVEDLMYNNETPIEYLDIFNVLNTRYSIEFRSFIEKCECTWAKLIKTSDKVFGDTRTVEIAINTIEGDIIHALVHSFALHNVKAHIMSLAKFIFNNVLTPIIKYNVAITVKSDYDQNDVLQINVLLTCQETLPYIIVFENIKMVFDFLNFINIPISDDECFMSEIAVFIKDDFTELLVKDCLMHTISSSPKLENDLYNDIKALQESLCASGFYVENVDTVIINFAKDFDVHFANKTCIEILHRAREIINQDVYDLLEVGEETEVLKDQTIRELPGEAPLSIPKCKISSNTMELKNLIYEVLEQCREASNMLRGRLLCTISNIVCIYQQIAYLPDNLKTSPQQIALLHNNCMYLAHYLLNISLQMKRFNITQEESRLVFYSDGMLSLRMLGSKHFTRNMKIQKEKILNTLRDSDLSSMSQLTKLHTTEQAIVECLELIAELKTAWHKVLPENIFDKSIALLYSVLLEELIQRVFCAEDIPAKIAEQLVNYFENVYNNATQIFKEHKDILCNVKSWQKFKELIHILKGNLNSIEQAWANGKGSIAAVFKPEDFRHLIRALFKNTDRRADLLMKIK